MTQRERIDQAGKLLGDQIAALIAEFQRRERCLVDHLEIRRETEGQFEIGVGIAFDIESDETNESE